MRHDWIFDVLKDLVSYAERNGLPLLALKAEEALQTAAEEIAAQDDDGSSDKGRAGSLH